jgi:hypothetical protein
MRVKTLLTVGLVIWGGSTVTVFAQSTEFVYPNSIGIRISNLDEDARLCGVTEKALETAVRLTMNRDIFVLLDEEIESQNRFKVSVLAIHRNYQCFLMAHLEFERFLRPTYVEWGMWATPWQRKIIMRGPSVGMGKMVTDQIELFAQEWIAQWWIDNPKGPPKR